MANFTPLAPGCGTVRIKTSNLLMSGQISRFLSFFKKNTEFKQKLNYLPTARTAPVKYNSQRKRCHYLPKHKHDLCQNMIRSRLARSEGKRTMSCSGDITGSGRSCLGGRTTVGMMRSWREVSSSVASSRICDTRGVFQHYRNTCVFEQQALLLYK